MFCKVVFHPVPLLENIRPVVDRDKPVNSELSTSWAWTLDSGLGLVYKKIFSACPQSSID